MYYGRYEHKIDSKGRLQIPVALREAEDDKIYNKFVLVRGIDDCLVLFTRDVFNQFYDAFDPESLGKHGTVEFMRQFFSRMQYLTLDNQGRILLPKLLREEVSLKDSALILGAGKWIEIWDKDVYHKQSETTELSYDDIARDFFATLGRKKAENTRNESTE